MIFRQVLHRDLGCASYFLADGGEAVVVDPRWDIDVYLELAAAEGVRIAYVLDTHQHADHVSGRERLAERTGARPYAPAAGEPDDERSGGEHASASERAEIAAGDTLSIGSLRLRAWATPGHRPEHLAFVVSDVSRSDRPWLVLSGDSLLVGDLARPDLAVEAQTGARELFWSVAELLELDDHVELWPAHVGGSLCGGAGLSGKTSSTIGYERAHNRLLGLEQEPFVGELLCELPPRPPNVARVVALNRACAPLAPTPVVELDAGALARAIAEGVRVIDGRAPDEFDAGHLPGAINLPPGRAQGTRAGWVIDADDRVVVIGSDVDHAREVLGGLHAVGLWDVVGVAASEPQRWSRAGLELRRSSSWDVATVAERIREGDVRLIDVRDAREWESCHMHGSLSVPLNRLAQRGTIEHLGVDAPLAVICAGGMRAAFAASVIRRRGHAHVVRVAGGGVAQLRDHGIPLVIGR